MASQAQEEQSGPPFSSPFAQMGGLPLVNPDVTICAVFLPFFVISAAIHMTIFRTNKARGHFFFFSVMFFGFSMLRIAALTMRIVWAHRPTNARVGIAASILVQAGVIIIFVINIFLSQRIVRAYHPKFGWTTPVRIVFRFLVASVVLSLLMTVVATVQSLYTLDTNTRRIDRDIQLFSGAYLAVLAFLPTPIVLTAVFWPRQNEIEKFGQGHFVIKVALLLFSSPILAFAATFRAYANFAAPLRTDPQWFDHKAAFYVLNFGLELIMSYTYAASRFDLRFHIPNGACKPGDYAAMYGKQPYNFSTELNTLARESDIFGRDDRTLAESMAEEEARERAWQARAMKELELQLEFEKLPPVPQQAYFHV